MAQVVLNRSKNQLKRVNRDAVAPGQVFTIVKKDGSLGKRLYGDLGNNGKHFSINLENGQLASTAAGSKQVAIVGKFTIKTKAGYRNHRETIRSAVQSGELFMHTGAGSTKTYMALGTLTDGRWAGLNMANPLNNDYTVAKNGYGKVTVIGVAEFNAEVTQ